MIRASLLDGLLCDYVSSDDQRGRRDALQYAISLEVEVR
jgi:hypothetical protein